MPDAFDRNPAPRVGLAELPLLAPPRSAWPRLQATLVARRRRRMLPWLAAAAALVLALALPRMLRTPDAPQLASASPPAPAATNRAVDGSAAPEAALRALMGESAQLEALLAWTQTGQVESASTAVLADALQQRIEELDTLLARADADPDARLPLWQERVLRLRQLAGVESTEQLLAANGDVDADAMVLAF
jgi:hypothetical protein